MDCSPLSTNIESKASHTDLSEDTNMYQLWNVFFNVCRTQTHTLPFIHTASVYLMFLVYCVWIYFSASSPSLSRWLLTYFHLASPTVVPLSLHITSVSSLQFRGLPTDRRCCTRWKSSFSVYLCSGFLVGGAKCGLTTEPQVGCRLCCFSTSSFFILLGIRCTYVGSHIWGSSFSFFTIYSMMVMKLLTTNKS